MLEEFNILKASAMPSAEQLTEFASKGDELCQIVTYGGDVFIYFKRTWIGANLSVNNHEYNVFFGDDLPNEDNLANLRDDGWQIVQLVPVGSNVYVYVRREVRG